MPHKAIQNMEVQVPIWMGKYLCFHFSSLSHKSMKKKVYLFVYFSPINLFMLCLFILYFLLTITHSQILHPSIFISSHQVIHLLYHHPSNHSLLQSPSLKPDLSINRLNSRNWGHEKHEMDEVKNF